MIVMVLINEVKKNGIDAEENERRLGGCQKDTVNEPATANMELELSGSKQLNGTMLLLASAATVWEKSFIQSIFWLTSYSGKSQRKLGKGQILTRCTMCVDMKSERMVVGSCSTFLFCGCRQKF